MKWNKQLANPPFIFSGKYKPTPISAEFLSSFKILRDINQAQMQLVQQTFSPLLEEEDKNIKDDCLKRIFYV